MDDTSDADASSTEHDATSKPIECPPEVERADSEPHVLVVAVTYNSRALISSFLRALPAALDGVGTARVVIIDNDSSDDTLGLVADIAPWVDRRSSGHNAGYAGGINVALREFTARSGVLILNPDAVAQPGCARLLDDAAHLDGVGLAVPRIESVAGTLKFSLRREPTLLRAIGEACLGGHRAAKYPKWGDMIRDPAFYVDGATCDWATGAAIFIRREALDDVGLWDERYFLYSEETDYCLRARDLGWRLRFVADAIVRHPGGEMSRSPRLWSILVLNRVRFYGTRHGRIATAAYWLVVFLNEAFRAALGRPTHRAAVKTLLTGRPATAD